MATVTFDTLKFVEKLRAAGMSGPQANAEAQARVSVFAEAIDHQLATKTDIARLERELFVIKWMMGVILGGIVAIILKTYFPA